MPVYDITYFYCNYIERYFDDVIKGLRLLLHGFYIIKA
jgi:hypothetical protein